MLSSCFFLLIAFSSVRSETININKASDRILFLMNALISGTGQTTTSVPAGNINDTIIYSEGTLKGLDTMVRTGDCVVNIGHSYAFDIHFGYSHLTAYFEKVTYNGEDMSASFSIGDNSLKLAFTVYNGTDCHIGLDGINYEKMAKVALKTSRPEFNGLDVDPFFQEYVMPKMDEILNADTSEVLKSLQFLCNLIL